MVVIVNVNLTFDRLVPHFRRFQPISSSSSSFRSPSMQWSSSIPSSLLATSSIPSSLQLYSSIPSSLKSSSSSHLNPSWLYICHCHYHHIHHLHHHRNHHHHLSNHHLQWSSGISSFDNNWASATGHIITSKLQGNPTLYHFLTTRYYA